MKRLLIIALLTVGVILGQQGTNNGRPTVPWSGTQSALLAATCDSTSYNYQYNGSIYVCGGAGTFVPWIVQGIVVSSYPIDPSGNQCVYSTNASPIYQWQNKLYLCNSSNVYELFAGGAVSGCVTSGTVLQAGDGTGGCTPTSLTPSAVSTSVTKSGTALQPPSSGTNVIPSVSTGTTSTGLYGLAATPHFFIDSFVNGIAHPSQPSCADLSGASASCSTDATNGSNISSGTVASARLAAVNLAAPGNGGVTGLLPNANTNIGTSGAKIPLLNGNNTHSGTNLVTGSFAPSGGGHISADQVNGNGVPASAVIGSNGSNQLINTNRAVGLNAGLSILNDLPSVKDPQYGVVADDIFYDCSAGSGTTAVTCAQGVLSSNYVSGGSFPTSGTCTVGTFNGGGTGATASLPVVATGVPTVLTITAFGSGYTSAPTTAVLGGSGCSGTIQISSTVSPALTAAVAGKLFNISGGGGNFTTTIATFNSATSLTLTDPTPFSFTPHLVEIGTDDTVAWQAVASSGVPVINFPAGKSLVNGTVVFQNQGIWGRGSRNSIVHCVASTGTCFQLQNQVFVSLDFMTGFRDFNITGPGAAAPGVNDICALVGGGNGATGAHLENMIIGNCTVGVEIGDNTYDVYLENNYITGNLKNVLITADTNAGGEAIKFFGNQISSGGPSPTDMSACFDVETGPFALTIYGGSIVGCQLKVTAGEVVMVGVHQEDPANHAQPMINQTGGSLTVYGMDAVLGSLSTQSWLTSSAGFTEVASGAAIVTAASGKYMITASGSSSGHIGKQVNYPASYAGWTDLLTSTSTGNWIVDSQVKAQVVLGGSTTYTPKQGEKTIICDGVSDTVTLPTPYLSPELLVTVSNFTNNTCTIAADSGTDLIVGGTGVASTLLYGFTSMQVQWMGQLGFWKAISGGTNFNALTSTGSNGSIQLSAGNQINFTSLGLLTAGNTMTVGTSSTAALNLETNNVVREGIAQGGPHTYATATVASATTITITGSVVFVTGTTPINTMTAPSGCTTGGTDCMVTLISDPATGPFSITTAGNFYAPYIATVGQAGTFFYHPANSKYYTYPSGPGIAASVKDLNRTSSLGSTTLLTAPLGMFRISAYNSSNSTVCTSVVAIAWTDKDGAQTANVIGSTATFGAGSQLVNVTSGNLTYSNTIGGACIGGTGFDTQVTVERLQ